MIFRVELPIVPSLNNAYAGSAASRRRFAVERHRNWKTEAGWLVKMANPPKIDGPYKFLILVPSGMAGDVSNRIKLAEDLLVDIGVTPDDHLAIEAAARRDHSVPNGRCVVVVESVSEDVT